MRRFLTALFFLWLSTPLYAQTVAQGVPGDPTEPWFVTGSFTFGSPQPVTGNWLTDAQLRATALPVSGTFFQATQPVSAATLPLPVGAATELKQDDANTFLNNIDVSTSRLGSTALNADGMSNVSVGNLRVWPMMFNVGPGTWDRLRGDATNGLIVNTEFPAASGLTDDMLPGNAPQGVGAFLMGWDSVGAAWDLHVRAVRSVGEDEAHESHLLLLGRERSRSSACRSF